MPQAAKFELGEYVMLAEADLNFTILLTITGMAFIVGLYFDLRTQRIPNAFCLLVTVIGIASQGYFNQWQGIINALLGLGLAFIVLFPVFVIKALGAGDVKFMMAIGTLLGPQLLSWSILYAIIAGAITSLSFAIYKTGWHGFKATATRYYHCLYLNRYFKPAAGEAAGIRVPYAPALALGWIWACSQNDDVLWTMSNVRYALFS
ncbi:A24 family peptidase [Thalassotalea fonticola]|uniref:A24 family peptidase n=1 Tax=Thalassotalea fonticola TaxID=3065649 RepID=A0ABZ0GTQ4_9GAMM|nr:A24 family peptidase [Colwelliaceae bacterium S1-1]